MPEVCFQLQWPDGQCSTLYSPSTVIHEYLNPGDCLTVSQMEARGLQALSAASERVRARYGFACTRTDEESARLREWVARYGPEDSVKIISQLA
ncbi:MSMEG_0570 family nitrogen starvation response protein [Synechococcus sp. MIT S9452]|uniref:MSMEG_0570 family nitrogen starvation response protein n=1 Tax=Synechococcus sp. MIT S9452 TaxID=3082546 RepID=UPI0039A63A25